MKNLMIHVNEFKLKLNKINQYKIKRNSVENSEIVQVWLTWINEYIKINMK